MDAKQKNGPKDPAACPGCGCRHSELIARSKTWSGLSVQRQCRHCGESWWRAATAEEKAEPADEDAARSVFRPLRCECGSADVLVTSTRRPVRHHICRSCGKRFKSVEAT